MTDAFAHHGHIVVLRELDNGTSLHEFWSLNSNWWQVDTDSEDTDPILTCYVAPWTGTSDEESDGLPHPDDRTGASCHWTAAPQEVRDAFYEEFRKINTFMDKLV